MVAQRLQERLSFACLGGYRSWGFLMTYLQSGGHRIWGSKHRRKLGCGSLKLSRRRVEPDGKGTKRPTALRALSARMPSH
jgi:hypothetical protein